MANVINLAQVAKRRYPAQFLQSLEIIVLDETSGQLLEYRQLHKQPKFFHIWNTSYANKLGRICQGVGKVSKVPKNQRVEVTKNFRIILFEDIPRDRQKESFRSMVVFEVKPQKEYSNRTRITAASGRIYYPINIGTPTGSIDLVKITINSVLSCCNAHFFWFDKNNFYLQTPMDQPKYMGIKLLNIPQEFNEEYIITQLVQNVCIYFDVLHGCYRLPQVQKNCQWLAAYTTQEGGLLRGIHDTWYLAP